MKHLLAIIFACLACVGTAQDNLSFAPYQCDNGAETLWLSKKPGNITIRVQVEVSGQRYIRCLLNGEFHHNHPVSGSGMVVVEYNGIGLGNPSPDHYITLSLWDDNVQTSEAISIGQIFPWLHGPTITVLPVSMTETSFQWKAVRGNFIGMPNSPVGTGGCPEHKLFLRQSLIPEELTLFDSIIELSESTGQIEYNLIWENLANPLSVCTNTSLVRMDMGTIGPPDFSPEELPLQVQELCETIGLLSTQVDEDDRSEVSIYPNPFDDWIVIDVSDAIEYEIHDLGGRLMQSGRGRATLETRELPSGMYTLTLITADGTHRTSRIVKN